MKNYLNIKLIFIFIFFSAFVFAQPTILWTKCYGGSSDDYSKSIIKTSDNGFLIVGGSTSFDGDVTGIHGYIDTVTGNTFTLGDAWVIKTDSLGNIQWQKCLGGSGIEVGKVGVETQGGYVIACVGSSADGDESFNNGINDYWVVKLDYSGNIIWEYSYGGDLEEQVYGLAATPDGGFVLSGNELSLDTDDINGHHGGAGDDIWIVKIDSSGLLQWQKCLGGTNTELLGKIIVDQIGNIFVAARAGSFNGDITCNFNLHNVWLVKLDSTGNIIWDKCFGGTGGQEINSLQLKEGKLLMAGWTGSSDGDLTHNYGYKDAWILLTDTAGNKIFSQSYGGSQTEEFVSACFTDNGKIIACGYTNSDDSDITFNYTPVNVGHGWLICTDSLGNLLWQKVYGGSYTDRIVSVISDQNNIIRFVGTTATQNNGDVIGSHGGYDVWLVNLDINTGIFETKDQINMIVFPQPFSDYINIRLPFSTFNNKITSVKLYNIEGKQINSSINIGESELRVTPKENLLPGLYILELITNNNVYDFKVLKM